MAESGTAAEPELSATNPTALEFGEAFRDMRRAHNIELSDVAKTLRIREGFLKAIENGQFDQLPGPAYATGFVRAYAGYLGLETDEVLHRYRSAIGNTPSHLSLTPLSPTAEARLPTGFILLVAAVLAAGTYGIWYYLKVYGQGVTQVISALPEPTPDAVGLAEKINNRSTFPVQKLSPGTAEKPKDRPSVTKEVSPQNSAVNVEKMIALIKPGKKLSPRKMTTKSPVI